MRRSSIVSLKTSRNQSHHWRSVALASVFWTNENQVYPKSSSQDLEQDNQAKSCTATQEPKLVPSQKLLPPCTVSELDSTLFTYRPKKSRRFRTKTESWKWQSADGWGKHMFQSSKNIACTPRRFVTDDDSTLEAKRNEEVNPEGALVQQEETDTKEEEFSLDQALEKVEQWDEDLGESVETDSHTSSKDNANTNTTEIGNNDNDNDSALTDAANQAIQTMGLLRNQELTNSVIGSSSHQQLQWETVAKYETSSRFLKANILTLRSSLLRTNDGSTTSTTTTHEPVDVEYTRACFERANVAKEIAALLDRVTLLLPEINKPMPLSPIQSNPHHRERRVREASKNYGQRSRDLAKHKKNQLQYNATKNRTKYFALRRTRAEAEEERNKRVTKNRQVIRDQHRHRGSKQLPPKEWQYEDQDELNSSVDNELNSSFLSNKEQHMVAMSMTASLQKQHRADRLIESHNMLASHVNKTWDEDTETDLHVPGVPGVRRPRLLKQGQRALSPLLAQSKSSSTTLLNYAAASTSPELLQTEESLLERSVDLNDTVVVCSSPTDNPALYYDLTVAHPSTSPSFSTATTGALSFSPHKPNLTRVKATVPSHQLFNSNNTANSRHNLASSNSLSSLPPPSLSPQHHGFQGPQVECLLRAIPTDSKDRFIRIALVEMNMKVSKIRTTCWSQLEDALNRHNFHKGFATPAPIDATTVRQCLRLLIAPHKGGHKRMTKAPTKMTTKGGEYIPYALRKKNKNLHSKTKTTPSASPITKSVLQRQVAKQQRAMSQRQMSAARQLSRSEFSMEKQTFERKIQKSIKNRKWETE